MQQLKQDGEKDNELLTFIASKGCNNYSAIMKFDKICSNESHLDSNKGPNVSWF